MCSLYRMCSLNKMCSLYRMCSLFLSLSLSLYDGARCTSDRDANILHRRSRAEKLVAHFKIFRRASTLLLPPPPSGVTVHSALHCILPRRKRHSSAVCSPLPPRLSCLHSVQPEHAFHGTLFYLYSRYFYSRSPFTCISSNLNTRSKRFIPSNKNNN